VAPKRCFSKKTDTSKKTKSDPDKKTDTSKKAKSDPDRWAYRYPLRQRLSAAWKGHHSPPIDPHIAEKAAANLLRRPEKAAELLSNLPMEQRRVIALSWALTELEEEFAKADKDLDGKLSYAEFKEWATKVIESGRERDTESKPTRKQLFQVAIATSVPFVGFGCVDNGLMVIYGDVIDSTLGVYLGASMLASAALGNAISNIFGMLLHGTINKQAEKLGLPDPRLTLTQRKMPQVHTWTTLGSTIGVFTGCVLGMTPLFFMNQTAKEEQRAAAKHH
jgi:hypothetical protein